MGVVQNIIGMVRDIKDRERTVGIDRAKKNYLTNPDAAIAAVNDISGGAGIDLRNQYIAEQAAAEAAKRSRAGADLGAFRESLRGLPSGTDFGAKIDELAPALQAQGVSPEHLATFKAAVAANPNILMDEKAYEAWSKDQFSNTVAPIGSHVIRAGQVIDKVPFAPKAVTTPAGATSTILDPNANDGRGAFVTGGGGGGPAAPGAGVGGGVSGPLTVDALRPLFVAQESNGDYTAVNKDTGALGRYQIMPDTGRTLAQRAGLPWRPDMMRKDDQASRNYQDRLGNAAIQESIDFGGGDAARTFSHYYGGSNESRWGPKTRRYTQEMLTRLGQAPGQQPGPQGGPIITPTSVSAPAKPPKPGTTYRAATKEELRAAGYPDGSAGQIGSDGKIVNLKTPPAANQPKPYDVNRANDFIQTMDRTGALVQSLLDNPGLDGAVGTIQGRMPGLMLGQTSQNFINDLDTLTKQIGLNELMRFKSISSQGASGFGNLSNEEGKRLESAWGTLNRTGDENVMRKSLRDILGIIQTSTNRTKQMMDIATAGGNPNAATQAPGSQTQAPVGTIVRVGNGRQIKTAHGWEPYNGR